METYTTKQVAEKVGVHKNTILNWIKSGKVEDVNRDWKNHRIWTRSDLTRLLEYKGRYNQLSLM